MSEFAHADSACNGKWVEHKKWPVTGAHIQVKCACSSCHDGALTAGTAPLTCVGCHMGAKSSAMQVSSTHIPTSDIACDGCHNVNSFLGVKMNHILVAKQACNTCHNKKFQLDVPSDHVQTILDCSVCHKADSWAAKFDHTKAKVTPATCNKCHLSGKNGATRKPNSHFITSESCDTCHSREN